MATERQRHDEARLFADACLWVQEAQTRSEVLRRANDAARLLLETSCSYCAVREGDMLHLVAHSGFRDPETARGWRLPVGAGIGGRVAERGETLVVRDYQHDPRRERFSKSLIDAEGLRCSIATPIRSGDRVVAVLYAAEHRLRRFTSGEVELITLFARSASAALTAVEERETLARRLAAHERAACETEVGRRLFQAVAPALAGEGGLEAALALLAERLECGAFVRDPFGHLLVRAGEHGGAETVFPVRAGRRQLAELGITREAPLGQPERLCLEQVAILVALWLVKERAALRDEPGSGSGFLSDLLHGRLGDEDTVARQAWILGVDLGVPRAVLCVGLRAPARAEQADAVTYRTAEVLKRVARARRLEPVFDLQGRDAVLLVRVREPDASVRGVVAGVLDEAGALLGGVRLAAGLGCSCRELREYAESYREAALALDIARVSPDEWRVRTYEDLGLYGLVARAVDPGMLDALARHTLEPLLRADGEGGTHHVRTLAAYLHAGRHLKPAAAALHVHVNTLRYRLGRIQELLGVDLEDADARFLLELAVRLLEVGQPVHLGPAG